MYKKGFSLCNLDVHGKEKSVAQRISLHSLLIMENVTPSMRRKMGNMTKYSEQVYASFRMVLE